MATLGAIVDQRHGGADGEILDGAPTYRTVGAALEGAPATGERYMVRIRPGRYREKLVIARPAVTLRGADRDATILTFDAAADTKRPDGTTYGTSGSASLTIRAPDLRAEHLTIENAFDQLGNAARPSGDPLKLSNTQAVALKTDRGSDRAAFVDVKLAGHQDTLFVDSGRHHFSRCVILGHVDFIFGAGRSVFDRCDVVSRDRGSATNNGYVTAASTPLAEAYGFLFIHCRLAKESPSMADGSVSLGRPWHPTTDLADGTRAADPNAFGSVVFKSCWLDAHISPRGWDVMSGRDKDGHTVTFSPADARFFEYASTGPGAIASPTRRLLSDAEARGCTADAVLRGWTPEP